MYPSIAKPSFDITDFIISPELHSRRTHFTTHPFQTISAPLNFDLKKPSGLEMSASFSSTQSTAPEIERFQGLFSYFLPLLRFM